jgi:hypothetical protein
MEYDTMMGRWPLTFFIVMSSIFSTVRLWLIKFWEYLKSPFCSSVVSEELFLVSDLGGWCRQHVYGAYELEQEYVLWKGNKNWNQYLRKSYMIFLVHSKICFLRYISNTFVPTKTRHNFPAFNGRRMSVQFLVRTPCFQIYASYTLYICKKFKLKYLWIFSIYTILYNT